MQTAFELWLARVEKDISLIHTRDAMSSGFKFKHRCTHQGIYVQDKQSKAWNKSSSYLYQCLVLASAKAHDIGVKELHQLIADNFTAIVSSFLQDAETDTERAIISAYTAADVQRHMSLVSPEELTAISGVGDPTLLQFLSR